MARSLRDADSRYTAKEGEALSLLWGIKNTQADILKSSKSIFWTDHQPLCALSNYSVDSPFSPRLSRLLSHIVASNVEVRYIEGRHQVLADYLSRSEGNDRLTILSLSSIDCIC